MKYVNKTLVGVGQDLLFGALLFASNKRMFSLSRDLIVPRNTAVIPSVSAPAPKYVYEGVCMQSDLDLLLREKNLPLDCDVVHVEFDGGFPLVFGVSE